MTMLAAQLSIFLREHLPRERRASPHTCEAYAYAFQLLVCFAAGRLGVKPSQLTIEQLDVPLILAFLEHVEAERQCSARTRNARLAAIHSLRIPTIAAIDSDRNQPPVPIEASR